jgi:hypothetical protein
MPHPEDRDGASTRCDVCGGKGEIPEEEYTAWMQDPAFVRDLKERTPSNYSDFYAREYPRFREAEVLAGRMPTMTLAEFVAFRRIEQEAPPIEPRFVRAAQPVGEFRMRCLAACHNGRIYYPHDQDLSSTCTMCAPHGGKGTIPAATVAEWMRDDGYRAYYVRTRKSDMMSFSSWSAEAAREALRRQAREARAIEADESSRRAAAGSSASWDKLTSEAHGTGRTSKEPPRPPRPPLPLPPLPPLPQDQADVCVMCLIREQTHLFNPCGHFGYCGPCTAELEWCPECRTRGTAIKVHRLTVGRVK